MKQNSKAVQQKSKKLMVKAYWHFLHFFQTTFENRNLEKQGKRSTYKGIK